MSKAIFITGAGSGIGRAVGLYFASRGWHVGVADVDEARADETCGLLPDGQSSLHVMDVRSRTDWQCELQAFVDRTGGRIDVLFNNAGVPVGGDFARTSFDDIDRLIAVNLMGAVNGARIAYPFFKANPATPCLLNMSSAGGLYGIDGLAVYSATKFAIRGLTEALDAEWAKDGIAVRSLMPSFIDTPFLDARVNGSEQTAREKIVAEGFEFTPVETVAEQAWLAVHGKALHTVIGKTARRIGFAARWTPAMLRKQ